MGQIFQVDISSAVWIQFSSSPSSGKSGQLSVVVRYEFYDSLSAFTPTPLNDGEIST